jgi:Leucine-rich repeat (LRR) protein
VTDIGGVPTNLQKLCILGCEVTDVSRLIACTALEELDLSLAPQGDYTPLANLRLKALSLTNYGDNGGNGDNGVQLMPTLEVLKITGLIALPEISSRLTALKELAIVDTLVTPEYVCNFSMLPSLTALCLDDCGLLPGVAALLPTQLRALTLTSHMV